MSTWYVASHNPGTSSFLDTDLVAVNFWVRRPVDGLDADGVKAVAAGHHPEWDRRTAGIQTNFARQLGLFASEIKVGDDVLTFDTAARDPVLIGKVSGPYRYEEPPRVSMTSIDCSIRNAGSIVMTGARESTNSSFGSAPA